MNGVSMSSPTRLNQDFASHRLVMAEDEWRQVVQFAVRPTGDVIIGPTGVHRGPIGDCVLVRRLESVRIEQLREWLLRWRDLIIISRQDPVAPQLLTELICNAGATHRHRLTLLSLGHGSSAGTLAGRRWLGGAQSRLESLSIVAPGMPSWSFTESTEELPASDVEGNPPERWSRTSGAMGRKAWSRLQTQTVVIVGCGRSGSAAAQMVALLGVRKIVLVDHDRVEQGNLDAMLGLSESDVGRYKVEVIAEQIARSRSDLAVTAVRTCVENRAAWRHLKESDLIISTVDRDAPRWLVSRLATLYLKSHLDIGTAILEENGERIMGADIRLLLPGGGCLNCVGGLRHSADALYALRAPERALQRGQHSEWHEQRAGSLVTVNAMAIGCGLQLWLDLLSGRLSGSTWLRFEWTADGHPVTRVMETTPDAGCLVCVDHGLGDHVAGDGN